MKDHTNAVGRRSVGARQRRHWRWRVVDIAVASVIGVASSLVFWAADFLPFDGLQALVPGLGGLINGLWLCAGPLAAVIIRKPGAAVYAELLAAFCESLLGDFWGVLKTILPGLVQGLFAELAFLLVGYGVWNLWTTLLSGALAGVGCWLYSFVGDLQAISLTGAYGLSYLTTTVISGIVFAGALVWRLCLAIARTGVLDRFESGRAARRRRMCQHALLRWRKAGVPRQYGTRVRGNHTECGHRKDRIVCGAFVSHFQERRS